jgi:hypothetical protein
MPSQRLQCLQAFRSIGRPARDSHDAAQQKGYRDCQRRRFAEAHGRFWNRHLVGSVQTQLNLPQNRGECPPVGRRVGAVRGQHFD